MGIYLINSDLNIISEGNYVTNDSKHTLVKELKAYKYNDKPPVMKRLYIKKERCFIYTKQICNT